MKLTAVFLLICFLQVSAKSLSQVTISVKDVSVEKVLREVERQTGVGFLYTRKMIKDLPRVTINVKNVPVTTVLNECFRGQELEYSFDKNTIVITKKAAMPATILTNTLTVSPPPPVEIHGRVTDQQGNPLANVSVIISGTSVGTTTNADGRFSITAPDNRNVSLEFSSVGYVAKKVSVGNQAEMNVMLEQVNSGLDEVVVIGYGTQKRSEITGAISSVKGSEIAGTQANGFEDALQGRIAGVDISPTTGQPGAPVEMNVRGVSTFGNGNPLFVIDGVPIMSDASSRILNPMASINPNDIQSIQVLKDASAAAIYGVRAANGVVIITTKRGNIGKAIVQFQFSSAFSKPTRYIKMMNSAQYAPYAIDALQNAGRPIPISLKEPLLSKNLQTNTNWQKELMHTGFIQDYWMGISGGTDIATFSFSGGYLNQGGNLPNSNYARYYTRVNSDFKIGKILKIGESVELSRNIWKGTFDPTSPNMNSLIMSSPTTPVYKADADGGFDGPRMEYSPVGRQNTIGLLTLIDDKRSINKAVGNAYLDITIIPGLTNRTNIGIEASFGESSTFTPTYDMGDYLNDKATLVQGSNSQNVYLLENITTYHHVFSANHNFTALIGFTQQNSWYKSMGVSLRDFPSNDLRTISAGFEKRDISGDETGWAIRSQMGRLSYSFKGKYNLMGVIRRDGSSRFGEDNRYGIFPSISGNWIISRESFMENNRIISNLALRMSYGKVGSQDINDFAQFAAVQPNINYILGDNQSLAAGSSFLDMGNSNLKWEITTQSNVGIDLGVLNQRLSFEMDYYIKNTDGILVQLPIPTTSGFGRNNGPFVNAGSIQNRGFEFTVNYQSEIRRDFSYLISGNLSVNKNKVTKLGNGQPIIVRWSRGKRFATSITQEGYPVGSLYGYIMEGVFEDLEDMNKHASQAGSSVGDLKFRDVNGDGVVDANDQTIIGNPFPNFSYGVNINLRYKNIDFVMLGQGKNGQDIFNLLWPSINDGEGDNNATTEMLDRWTPQNTKAKFPRAVAGDPGQNTRPSTRFVENGSYFRIKNVQIGYDFNSSILRKWKLNQFRIYVSAENLFTFTNYKGYNPEIAPLFEGSRSSMMRNVDNASYPIPRTLGAGLQIQF